MSTVHLSPHHPCHSSSSPYSNSRPDPRQRSSIFPNPFSLNKNLSFPSNSRSVSSFNLVHMQHGVVTATAVPIKDEIPLEKLKNGPSPVTTPPEECKKTVDFEINEDNSTVSITVVGASGDLAKKKIFPALFALYYEGCLPQHFTVFGYARSKMSDADPREMVSRTLTCRIDKR